MPSGRRCVVPEKITSSIFAPRKFRILCSPNAQRIASDKLLLPLPFGPTIALIPGLNSSSVLSANDLKPKTSNFFRSKPSHPVFHFIFTEWKTHFTIKNCNMRNRATQIKPVRQRMRTGIKANDDSYRGSTRKCKAVFSCPSISISANEGMATRLIPAGAK